MKFNFYEWKLALYEALRSRLRSDRSDDRLERITRRQPLWDYWSSGYEPRDAALEMELVR